MNGSPSVKVALFIRNGGSESPCRWFYVTEIYTFSIKILFILKFIITFDCLIEIIKGPTNINITTNFMTNPTFGLQFVMMVFLFF